MGTGHVMRCLALAQAWRDSGGQVRFAVCEISESLTKRLRAEQFEITSLTGAPGSRSDADRTAELAHQDGTVWVVVDGYHFGGEYQQTIKTAGKKLLFLDDYGHADRYRADLILNQNLGANAGMYPGRESYTKFLLGPRYALLRREFGEYRRRREIGSVAKRLLVTMGGSDPQHATEFVVGAIARSGLSDFELKIVVGGSNPHVESIRERLRAAALDAAVLQDAANMPELLAQSDLVIAGAGTTCWEICLLGIPSILIELAPNQHGLAKGLHDAGAALYAGKLAEISRDDLGQMIKSVAPSQVMRTHLSKASRRLLDSQGARRVVAHLKNGLRLREIKEGDCRLLWEWANDAQARRMSFSQNPIPWEEHVRWLKEKLASPSTVFYMACREDGTAVGEVRYELEEDRAVLSISISPKFRGNGYGKHALLMATEQLFQRSSSTKAVDAYVKPENTTSIQLFESAGFHREGLRVHGGREGIHFVLPKRTT